MRKGCAFYATLYQEMLFGNPGGGGSLIYQLITLIVWPGVLGYFLSGPACIIYMILFSVCVNTLGCLVSIHSPMITYLLISRSQSKAYNDHYCSAHFNPEGERNYSASIKSFQRLS